MDDEIIYSCFFNFVECFDLTPSATIIVLVENLESLSSLRSEQYSNAQFNLPPDWSNCRQIKACFAQWHYIIKIQTQISLQKKGGEISPRKKNICF